MPTVAGAIIFVPPLFLLGTVTAGLNKFATTSLEDNASGSAACPPTCSSACSPSR